MVKGRHAPLPWVIGKLRSHLIKNFRSGINFRQETDWLWQSGIWKMLKFAAFTSGAEHTKADFVLFTRRGGQLMIIPKGL
jgi:hypothetical protein